MRRNNPVKIPHCPDCGGPLVHGEGCICCPLCGFTRCYTRATWRMGWTR